MPIYFILWCWVIPFGSAKCIYPWRHPSTATVASIHFRTTGAEQHHILEPLHWTAGRLVKSCQWSLDLLGASPWRGPQKHLRMVGKEGNFLHGLVSDNVPDRRVYPGEFQFSENRGYGEEDLLEIRSLGIPSLLGPHFPGSECLGRAGARHSHSRSGWAVSHQRGTTGLPGKGLRKQVCPRSEAWPQVGRDPLRCYCGCRAQKLDVPPKIVSLGNTSKSRTPPFSASAILLCFSFLCYIAIKYPSEKVVEIYFLLFIFQTKFSTDKLWFWRLV